MVGRKDWGSLSFNHVLPAMCFRRIGASLEFEIFILFILLNPEANKATNNLMENLIFSIKIVLIKV